MRVVGRALVVVGVVGVVAALLGTVVAWRLLGALDDSLVDSVTVTTDAVEALATTVDVAASALGDTTVVLRSAGNTTTTVAGGVDDAVTVLDGAADVTGDEVAGSLAAVEDSLPALIDVAGVIDTTLGALSRVPFGPEYDPEVAFDDSLRAVRAELDGLPEALRDEARLLREGATSLDQVGDAVLTVGDDLRALTATLDEAEATLLRLADVTEGAATTLAAGSDTLGGQVRAARWLVVVLGLAIAAGQLVPLLAGVVLVRDERARDVLAGALRTAGRSPHDSR